METDSVNCEDGFNEFVHGRTAKTRLDTDTIYKSATATSISNLCDKSVNIREIDNNADSLSTHTVSVSDVYRSEGSGSENGAETIENDFNWHRHRYIKDKCHSPVIPVHNKTLADCDYLNISCTTHTSKFPTKRDASSWRAERMDSFESNKEYVGSDCVSPLSCNTPSKTSTSVCMSSSIHERDPGYWDDDDDWEPTERPTGERWPPLGAPNDDEDCQSVHSFEQLFGPGSNVGRLKELEEEQEHLNTSLLSLTSHFAQVQFRLKQIVSADSGERERLLRELEQFADRGVPDLRAIQQTRDEVEKRAANLALSDQCQLIARLKQQLDELEQYAYHTGEAGLPQTVLVQKQKVIIDQLKGKLPLDLEDLSKISVEDLRAQVDVSVKQLVNPLKMKEQLVSQLQTQIGDLERFINFLQDGSLNKLPADVLSPSKCKCGGHGPEGSGDSECRRPPSGGARGCGTARAAPRRTRGRTIAQEKQQLREDTARLVDRAALLVNMLRFAQLGCGAAPSSGTTAHTIPEGCHWGDLRANLEVCIARLVEVLSAVGSASDYTSDSDAGPATPVTNTQEVTLAVRKHLVPALRDLLHHGLQPTNSSRSLVSAWSCFPIRSVPQQMLHAWDLVLQYYRMKRGDHYNTTPARRLSQSFNLELSSGGSGPCFAGHKGALLAAVGNILATHTPLKRSPDSHFKAFVSEALNQQRLVVWLRLILRCQPLVQKCYQPWSYVLQTGFDDAFKSLETLQQYQFSLPVDLAVRSLRNITDAF